MKIHILTIVTNKVHEILKFSLHKLGWVFPWMSTSFMKIVFYGYIKMEIPQCIKTISYCWPFRLHWLSFLLYINTYFFIIYDYIYYVIPLSVHDSLFLSNRFILKLKSLKWNYWTKNSEFWQLLFYTYNAFPQVFISSHTVAEHNKRKVETSAKTVPSVLMSSNLIFAPSLPFSKKVRKNCDILLY